MKGLLLLLGIVLSGFAIEVFGEASGIPAPSKKIAFVNQVTGSNHENNQKYLETLLQGVANNSKDVVIEKADVENGMKKLGISTESKFYDGKPVDKKQLFDLGKQLGADFICANVLDVNARAIKRFGYKDKAVTSKLQYLVLDVAKGTQAYEAETTNRRDRRNRLGFAVSAFVILPGGYLTKVGISKEEKASIDTCVDTAYEWLQPSDTRKDDAKKH